MKKILAAVVAASSLTAVNAFASSAFDGFYAGATITSNAAKMDMSFPNVSFSTGEGARQIGFGINLGYGKTFGQFYLAGEAAYAINQGETGTGTINGVNISAKANNVKSISILPGFVVNKDLLFYARLSKGTLDGELTLSSGNTSISDSGDTDIITKGIGLEYAVNTNLAVRAEFSVSDGDESFATGQKNTVYANSLAAGIQYRF